MATTYPIHDSQVPPAKAMSLETILLRARVANAPRADAVTTFIVGVITFGLYPAVIWPLRFRNVIDAERFRLGRVAQWLEARGDHPDIKRLRHSADAIRFRPLLYLIGFAACAAWVALFFGCGGTRSATHWLLMPGTYYFNPALLANPEWASQFIHHGRRAPVWAIRSTLFAGWLAALSLAFVTHWLQVQLHARSVRRFLDNFNKIVVHEGLSPVFLAPVGLGVRPTWVIGAIVLAWMNAPWGIPLMLTGCVQRRYTTRAAPDMRNALATRLRDLSVLPRPVPFAIRSAPAADPRARCTTEGCRTPLPAGARFCPRCGRRAMPRVDRVA